mmetsp:Transcript_8141/g.22593  ORF Transcript_8141/g.22593 Transcript_8141/m.22593 type:complete len:125 (-) Transcript_8141:284-658(-)|eukprot:CAMPEP_0168723688 /NCGR_PEP_ID=MMETSP0724-20121128/3245_1 /TAXON_ID=265536 /ORGANISM="Amphiprora sp., Strain CCMP467" /LENGTH=124 /DNA_ID=CAMNT_0008770405 /DNA_START=171 /DNA_END=545 /DNA_ORIENTATION=+
MNALRSTLLSGIPASGRVVTSSWSVHAGAFPQLQSREMSKYLSKQARKRLPLTSKRATKQGFYKGNRCRKEGYINSKGHYRPDPLRKVELMVPDLNGFKLKPYIAASASRYPPEERFDGPQLGR